MANIKVWLGHEGQETSHKSRIVLKIRKNLNLSKFRNLAEWILFRYLYHVHVILTLANNDGQLENRSSFNAPPNCSKQTIGTHISKDEAVVRA